MWRKHGNRVQWTRFPCIETEFIELVWTRFPCIETEFIELVFHELSSHGFASERSWSDVIISLSDRAQSVRLLANEFIELVFIELSSHGFAWSSSTKDRWLRLQIVLVFHTWKTSLMNSFSMYRKQVLWTCFSP